jgi:serine/threonine-protein kinase HipA
MRMGNVYYKNNLAGIIAENEDGYTFQYDDDFLNSSSVKPISLNIAYSKGLHFKAKFYFPFLMD